MAKYQRVKFTGDRTGLERIRLPRHGTVSQGDEVLVPAEDADRWTAKLPTAEIGDDGKQVERSDFESTGGSKEMTRQEYSAAVLEDRKAAPAEVEDDRTNDALREELKEAGLSTAGNKAELQARLASHTGEGQTVEEYAETRDDLIEATESPGEAGDGEETEA